jgi:hypothetical protein
MLSNATRVPLQIGPTSTRTFKSTKGHEKSVFVEGLAGSGHGCPGEVNVSNWLGTDTYGDRFGVEVSAGCFPTGAEETSVSYAAPTARVVGAGVCAEPAPFTAAVGGAARVDSP